MKKILFAVMLLGAAAGCTTQTINPPANTQPENNQPQTQTYRNSQYGFQFDYPDSFSFSDPVYANLENKIASVGIGKEAYPKTNFGDASFTVSAQYAKSLQDCLALPSADYSNSPKTTKTINGTTFYYTEGTGAAAGNLYQSRTYRSLNGASLCVELLETIHTSNIGNYEPGTVTQVDAGPIWQQLDQVANSFKFAK